jgi:hypothetical protein
LHWWAAQVSTLRPWLVIRVPPPTVAREDHLLTANSSKPLGREAERHASDGAPVAFFFGAIFSLLGDLFFS